MSEYELLSLINESIDGITSNTAILVTLLFAYFLVAHFAGKILSAIQLAIVSAIYSFAVLITLTISYSQTLRVWEYAAELITLGSNHTTNLPAGAPLVLTTIFFVAYLSSLYYMYSCRK